MDSPAPESDFQDDLILALEQEVSTAPESAVNPGVAESVEVHAEDVASADNQLADDLREMQAAILSEEPPAPTPEEGQLPVSSSEEELLNELETSQPPQAAIEEDLGAAFATEVEQMLEQAPAEVMEEQSLPVEQSAAEEEIDFESAFAEELQVASIPQAEGWDENATEEANAAFVAAAGVAATPDTQPRDVPFDHDPGHAGSIEEIAAVEGAPLGANDNNVGGKKYAIAALVIALFAGAIAAGYGFLGGGEGNQLAAGTPELIKADAEPVKVKPEEPSGTVVANQDNVSYKGADGEDTGKVSQELLVSQTEEPAVIETPKLPAAEPGIQVSDLTSKSDERLAPDDSAEATPTRQPNSTVQPKVVQTVVVKPDGTILNKPAAPKPEPVETALAEPVTIGGGAEVPPKPVSTQVVKKPESIDGAQSTGDLVIPTASPLPKPVVVAKPKPAKKVAAAKPKPVANTPAKKSEWVVQVSSQRSPEAAQSSFRNMRNKYSVLRGRAMSIQRAQVNGATYFRVRVQTASRDDATQLCSKLAAAGGSCFVTR